MTRRSRLAACLVALVAVGWLVVGVEPRSTAFASDPILDAKAKQAQLQSQLAAQQAQLASLRADAAQLSNALSYAKNQLASVSAQYQKVADVLGQVTKDVAEVQGQLSALNHQIATLDTQLKQIASDIVTQTEELGEREALLQEHLRAAYEQSQTSLLEVLLSSKSLDDATNQVGYLLTVSDGDKALADEITALRQSLQIKEQNLRDGRAALKDARAQAQIQEQQLVAKRAELTALQTQLAELKREWEAQKARQEAALNASLKAQKNVQAQIGKIRGRGRRPGSAGQEAPGPAAGRVHRSVPAASAGPRWGITLPSTSAPQRSRSSRRTRTRAFTTPISTRDSTSASGAGRPSTPLATGTWPHLASR